MEQKVDLLEKVKHNITDDNKEIIKDLISINGALVDDNDVLDSDKKVILYNKLEKKYHLILSKLKYYSFVNKVEKKVEKFVESDQKNINSLLGTLKMFLTRISAFSVVEDKRIIELKSEIAKEDNYKKLVKLYEELDSILIESLN